MARKTRRRGKRVRATRRVRRIGRVRRVRRSRGRSRGGSRRYNNGGGLFPTLDEVLTKAKTLGQEALTEAQTLGNQVTALGSKTLSRFTQPSASM